MNAQEFDRWLAERMARVPGFAEGSPGHRLLALVIAEAAVRTVAEGSEERVQLGKMRGWVMEAGVHRDVAGCWDASRAAVGRYSAGRAVYWAMESLCEPGLRWVAGPFNCADLAREVGVSVDRLHELAVWTERAVGRDGWMDALDVLWAAPTWGVAEAVEAVARWEDWLAVGMDGYAETGWVEEARRRMGAMGGVPVAGGVV